MKVFAQPFTKGWKVFAPLFSKSGKASGYLPNSKNIILKVLWFSDEVRKLLSFQESRAGNNHSGEDLIAANARGSLAGVGDTLRIMQM